MRMEVTSHTVAIYFSIGKDTQKLPGWCKYDAGGLHQCIYPAIQGDGRADSERIPDHVDARPAALSDTAAIELPRRWQGLRDAPHEGIAPVQE